MRITTTLLLLLVVTTLQAQSGFDIKNYETFFDLNNYLTQAQEAQEEVDFTCAIFITPVEAQVRQLQDVYGDEFDVIADDQSYYMDLASELIEQFKIKTIQLQSGIIQLTGDASRESWTLDTNKEGAPSWNLILFHVNKPPTIASIMAITEKEVKEYFNVAE